MQGHGGGNFGDYGESIGGDCDKDGWVKSGGVVPLSWDFSDGLASSLESLIWLSLLRWVNR